MAIRYPWVWTAVAGILVTATPVLADTCPGETNASQPYPDILSVTFANPSAPAKLLPAVPVSPVDRRSLVGHSTRDGKITLNITFAAPIAAGCTIRFDVIDQGAGVARSRDGSGRAQVQEVLGAYNGTGYGYLNVMADGSATTQVTLPIAARLGSSKIYRFQIYTLDNSRTSSTSLFEFENRPFVLQSVTVAKASVGPAEQVEVFANFNETLSPEDYDIRVNGQVVDNDLNLVYTNEKPDTGNLNTVETFAYKPQVTSRLDSGAAPPRDRVVFRSASQKPKPAGPLVYVYDDVSTRIRVDLQLNGQTSSGGAVPLTVKNLAPVPFVASQQRLPAPVTGVATPTVKPVMPDTGVKPAG